MEWKSPRKVEEEITQYRRDRFERQMSLVDQGIMPEHVAISALREEIAAEADLDEFDTMEEAEEAVQSRRG